MEFLFFRHLNQWPWFTLHKTYKNKRLWIIQAFYLLHFRVLNIKTKAVHILSITSPNRIKIYIKLLAVKNHIILFKFCFVYSHIASAPLTWTLSERMMPVCGISTQASNSLSRFTGIPSFSFPSKRAHLLGKLN